MAFQLKLANYDATKKFASIDFFQNSESDGLSTPVFAATVGDTVQYGALFAYLFRRFGYPNSGWDDYKQLTKYELTTPHPDLILGIVPHVSNSASLTFTFYASLSQRSAVRDWEDRPRDEWKARVFKWAEANGLPEWMPEWVEFCAARKDQTGSSMTWRETAPYIHCAWPSMNAAESKVHKSAIKFWKSFYANYRAIEAEPAIRSRAPDYNEWDGDDPLKPLAAAAIVALNDLRRPVGVRDSDINVSGLIVDAARGMKLRACKPAMVAGYPSGALGNVDPVFMGMLHCEVLRLGKGNIKLGLRKALTALRSTAIAPAAVAAKR